MRLVQFFLVLVLGPLVGGCASVRLTDTWKAPEVKELRFSKIVAVAIAPRKEQRLAAEDEIVAELSGLGPLSQSLHRLMPDISLDDVEEAKRTLTEAGFDGAVVVRVVSGDSRFRLQYSGGRSEFSGLQGVLQDGMPAQALATELELVRLETVIYSLKEDRLLWTGMSTAMDSSSVASLIDDLAVQIRTELQNEGLLY